MRIRGQIRYKPGGVTACANTQHVPRGHHSHGQRKHKADGWTLSQPAKKWGYELKQLDLSLLASYGFAKHQPKRCPCFDNGTFAIGVYDGLTFDIHTTRQPTCDLLEPPLNLGTWISDAGVALTSNRSLRGHTQIADTTSVSRLSRFRYSSTTAPAFFELSG